MAGDNLQPHAGLVVAPQQQQGPLLELLCDLIQGVALGCPVLLPLQHCSCTVLGQLLVLDRLLHINNNNNNNNNNDDDDNNDDNNNDEEEDNNK